MALVPESLPFVLLVAHFRCWVRLWLNWEMLPNMARCCWCGRLWLSSIPKRWQLVALPTQRSCWQGNSAVGHCNCVLLIIYRHNFAQNLSMEKRFVLLWNFSSVDHICLNLLLLYHVALLSRHRHSFARDERFLSIAHRIVKLLSRRLLIVEIWAWEQIASRVIIVKFIFDIFFYLLLPGRYLVFL